MYVLKFIQDAPEYFEEPFYDEVVSVKNNIALVINEHNRDALLGMGYEYLGVIQDSSELQKILDKDKKKAENEKIRLDVKTKVLKITDILPPDETEQEEQTKAWIDSLE